MPPPQNKPASGSSAAASPGALNTNSRNPASPPQIQTGKTLPPHTIAANRAQCQLRASHLLIHKNYWAKIPAKPRPRQTNANSASHTAVLNVPMGRLVRGEYKPAANCQANTKIARY